MEDERTEKICNELRDYIKYSADNCNYVLEPLSLYNNGCMLLGISTEIARKIKRENDLPIINSIDGKIIGYARRCRRYNKYRASKYSNFITIVENVIKICRFDIEEFYFGDSLLLYGERTDLNNRQLYYNLMATIHNQEIEVNKNFKNKVRPYEPSDCESECEATYDAYGGFDVEDISNMTIPYIRVEIFKKLSKDYPELAT